MKLVLIIDRLILPDGSKIAAPEPKQFLTVQIIGEDAEKMEEILRADIMPVFAFPPMTKGQL